MGLLVRVGALIIADLAVLVLVVALVLALALVLARFRKYSFEV